MSALLYLLHALLLPLALVGLLRTLKARLLNRIGPSPWQPFRDAAKLLRKGQTVSATTTWVFSLAPLVLLGSTLVLALMVPWLGMDPPLSGDIFLAVYLLALGKFAVSLAALDSGSAFGALGASREAAISVQSEPALLMGLGALAVHAHASSMGALFAGAPGGGSLVLVPLLALSLWLSAMAELSRMPVDDPTTHLELTMVHEAMLLENSGPNLALMEYATALKMTVLLGLIGQLPRLVVADVSPYLLSLGALAVGVVAIAAGEAVLVKLRWRRIPHLLAYASLAASLAGLIVAVRP